MYNCVLVETVSTVQGVVALDFHLTFSVLASGSRDCMVKFFWLLQALSKALVLFYPWGSHCSLPRVSPVWRLHAGWDRTVHTYVSKLASVLWTHKCMHKLIVRLYDVNTLQCYVSPDARDQHTQSSNYISKCSRGCYYISECSIFMFSHE